MMNDRRAEVIIGLIALIVACIALVFGQDLYSSITGHSVIEDVRGLWEGNVARPEAIEVRGEVWTVSFTQSHIYLTHPVSERNYRDFSVEVDVRFDDTSPEFHGLLFRQQDDKRFYSFRISPDGKYSFDVWKANGNSYTSILGPATSDLIHTGQGQTNHLKVNASGKRFDLYLNDTKLATVEDTTFVYGKVGLVSCTCDGSSHSNTTFFNFSLEP